MNAAKKSWLKWLLILLVVGAVAAAAGFALSARKAQQTAIAVAAAAKQTVSVELAASDVVKAQMLDIAQGIAVSGSLKAVN